MSKLRMSVRLSDIEEVARQIGERFRPKKIVLFGSHAYGKPTLDSDVDLLVIMDTPLPNVEQAVEIRRAVEFSFPTDLMVRTPKLVAERLSLGDTFLREVLGKGVVLYEADDARVD
jgi:predicted nucleotidyltransferase